MGSGAGGAGGGATIGAGGGGGTQKWKFTPIRKTFSRLWEERGVQAIFRPVSRRPYVCDKGPSAAKAGEIEGVWMVAGATISRRRPRWSRIPCGSPTPRSTRRIVSGRRSSPVAGILVRSGLFGVAPIIGAVIAGLVTLWLHEPIPSQEDPSL
jgi:hypothetical protein